MGERRTGDTRIISLEERAMTFQNIVQEVCADLDGEARYALRALGQKIIEFHATQVEEEKEDVKEKINKMYDQLKGKKDAKVEAAVRDMTLAEVTLF